MKLRQKNRFLQLEQKMIKKLLVSSIIVAMTALSAFAVDKFPTSSRSIRHYGIGLLKMEKNFDAYVAPTEKSRKIKHFNLPVTNSQSAIIRDSRNTYNPYIVNMPSMNEFYTAIAEYPENGWAQIYINQNGNQLGWVKIKDDSNFLTWKEFVYKFGRENGVKLMTDVPKTQFKLYSKDSEDAQVVDEFTYPEQVALRIIRGNWALVTVVDSGSIYKTGWFKWRTDDGKLRIFPKMK